MQMMRIRDDQKSNNKKCGKMMLLISMVYDANIFTCDKASQLYNICALLNYIFKKRPSKAKDLILKFKKLFTRRKLIFLASEIEEQ